MDQLHCPKINILPVWKNRLFPVRRSDFLKTVLLPLAAALFPLPQATEAVELQNKYYIVNRVPLQQTAYVHLPPGAVRARGWLEDQLRIQADGVTSYLWSAFAYPFSDSNPPYHQEGVVSLALVLGDNPRLSSLAKAYVDRQLSFERNETNRVLTFANACIMHFMAEYQEATGDPRIVTWMREWYRRAGTFVPEEHYWQHQGSHEHLGPIYWLYNRTGDPELLEQAKKIVVREKTPPELWKRGDFDKHHDSTLPGWKVPGIDDIALGFLQFPDLKTTTHGVMTAWRMKYPVLYWQQQPEETYRQAYYEGTKRLDQWFGQIAGRYAAHENFPAQATGRKPTHGTEMCNSVQYAYSMENILEILGDPAAADRIEALAYNVWPGQMSADMWCNQYDTQSNQVVANVANRGFDNSPWASVYGFSANWACCLAGKHQAWPRLVKSMWMATHDNGLIALVYGPSEVTAKVGSKGQTVTVTQETEYPFDGKIKFTIKTSQAVEFPFSLRIPAWAKGASVKTIGAKAAPPTGETVTFKQQWKNGDVVELDLPMPLQVEERFNGAAAIRRGPLYFSLRIGSDYRECLWKSPCTREGHLLAKPWREKTGFPLYDWEIYPTTPWNYALKLDRNHPEASLKLVRNPIGKMPFGGRGEPVIIKVPEDDSARVQRAPFKAEISYALPHPAEATLKIEGNPWPATFKEANNDRPFGWLIDTTSEMFKAWPQFPLKGPKRVGFERITLKQDEPLILKAKARLVPEWKLLEGKNPASGKMVPAMADVTPQSPVVSNEPEVEVELVPFGCTRLRITEFPTLGPAAAAQAK